MKKLAEIVFNQALDFSEVTPENIDLWVEQIHTLYNSTYDTIAALKNQPEKINFQTVIQPILDLHIVTAKAYALCSFPRRVFTEEEIRNRSNAAVDRLEILQIESELNLEVYKVFKFYYETRFPSESPLTKEEKRFVEKLHLYYKRHGLHLENVETLSEIKKIKEEIAFLALQYEKNLDEDNTVLKLSKKELTGLPSSWFTPEKEIDAENYQITLKYPDVIPILEYASNRLVRKQIFTAFVNRSAEANIPLLTKIIALRQKHATLLGYESHADYMLELRMAKTRQNVKNFLDEMNNRFTPALKKMFQDVTAFASHQESDPHYSLVVQDLRYYMRLQAEAACQLDMEKIKEFFPEEKVISGTLSIYETVLGLKFVENFTRNKWHEEVKCYDVYNATQHSIEEEKIGQIYLDLYPRPGKFGHAAVFDIVPGCDISSISGKKGDRRLPIAAMVCNFPKNSGIPFDDVVTFFHEFGHLMHVICSKTQLEAFFAFKVELDFVEAPSQLLENWCYDDNILKILSEHPVTKTSLPKGMAEKLRDMDKLHAAYVNKRQLVFAYLDYAVHTLTEAELKALDIQDLYRKIHQEVLGLATIENDGTPGNFAHLVGGYDAGYYGYMMSATYAADMFDSIFKKDPLSSEAGKKYRETLLEPGATRDGMELIESFLGRKPKIEAFLRQNGLGGD